MNSECKSFYISHEYSLWQDLSMGASIFYPVTWPWRFTSFLKTFTIIISFEQPVLELWYFTWVFFVTKPFYGYQHLLPCDLDLVTLTLEFDLFSKNFNLANNFWTVSARVLLFHLSIFCDKFFLWIPLFLPCDVDLGVSPIFWRL